MSEILRLHPDNPQLRQIKLAVAILQKGGVIIYPTDSGYAIGCILENKKGLERIKQIRALDNHHHFTLICRNLSEIATYAFISNVYFRVLKANTPGAYTFILPATKEVPKRLMHPKRNTIGIRVPDHLIVQALLTALDAPLMSVTLHVDDEDDYVEAEDIYARFAKQVDLVIDGGYCILQPTTIVDLEGESPVIIRQGKGDVAPFV